MSTSNNMSERRSVSSPKKKKRKYSIDNASNECESISCNNPNTQRNNYLNNGSINIIDRVLDLTKYNKNTSLYALARDWLNASNQIKQKPQKPQTSQEQVVNEDENYFVNKLPPPSSTQADISIKELNERLDLNVRSTARNDLELIETLNVEDTIKSHALLKLNVNRWKLVRKEWLRFYAEKNKPYKESYDILRSIYEEI
jgi:hypothetical protein